jgi:hypothetical protein
MADPTAQERLDYLYIAGSGHSGSTLLSFLVNCHPKVFAIGEAHASRVRRDPESRVCSCGEALRSCTFFRKQSALFSRAGLDFDPATWTLNYAIDGRPLLSRLLMRSLRNRPLEVLRGWLLGLVPAYRRMLRGLDEKNRIFVRNALAITKSRVFADTSKDPFRIYHLRRMPFFRLKVIHLIRDPRAVVYSALKRHRERGARDEDFDDAGLAAKWVRTQSNVERRLRGMGPGERLLVRYEDLCRDPEAELAKIGVFAGVGTVPLPESFRSPEHHIMGNVMREGRDGVSTVTLDEGWIHSLPVEMQERVMGVAGAVAQRYGYEAAKAAADKG